MTETTALNYYGQPLLKEPVWIPSIPVYFFVGGAARVAMTMGMVPQYAGGYRLAERCRWAGAIGGGIGSALLIFNLGYNTRFLNMLRVLRPTSPMSVGSWVLALATPASLGSALFHSRFLAYVAGLLGMPLATHTAVLIGNTAIPVWYRSRRTLPFLFGASSISGMASVFQPMPLRRREQAIIDGFALIGRTADLLAGVAMEQESPQIASRMWRAHRAYRGQPGCSRCPARTGPLSRSRESSAFLEAFACALPSLRPAGGAKPVCSLKPATSLYIGATGSPRRPKPTALLTRPHWVGQALSPAPLALDQRLISSDGAIRAQVIIVGGFSFIWRQLIPYGPPLPPRITAEWLPNRRIHAQGLARPQ